MRIGQISAVAFASEFVSSVIGFVATIYLARILGADVLGTYFLVIAVVIWLTVLSVMGVQSAITKRLSEREDDDAFLTAGLVLVLVVFVVIASGVTVFSGALTHYLGAPVVEYVVVLLFVGMAYRYMEGVLQGQHLVHVAAFLKPVDRTVRSILQIAAAFLGFGLIGILAGYVIGGIVALAVGAYFLSARLTVPERSHVRSIVSFARYAWLGQLSSRTFSSMDTVVLGLFVSSTLIGYYEIAWNLASILALFGTAISQTMYPEISRVASEGDLEKVQGFLYDALSHTGLFLIPGLVGAVVMGDWVLTIYGREFARAYVVLLVLIGARLIHAYGNQLLNTLNGLDRPDVSFRINGAFVVSNVALNVVLVSIFGWIGAAVATTLSAMIILVLGYYGLSQLLDVPIPGREVSKQWTAAILMGAVIYAGRMFFDGTLVLTIVLVLCGSAVYFAVLSVLSTEFRGTVRRNVDLGFL